jgi:hypothetical protein
VEARVGELGMTLFEARDVMAASKSLAAQGVYCYDS